MEHKAIPVTEYTEEAPNHKRTPIPHRQWMDALLYYLARCEHVFHLNPIHSFDQDGQISQLISFSRLVLQDAQSKIHLMLFVHYTETQKPRLYLRAIRKLCGNRMLFTTVLDEWTGEPDKGCSLEELPQRLGQLSAIRTAVQKRINWLQRLRTKDRHLGEISSRISPNLGQRLPSQIMVNRLNQWQLYNLVTHYISREVKESQQLELLLQASRIFKL